jgi:hypothetical protein
VVRYIFRRVIHGLEGPFQTHNSFQVLYEVTKKSFFLAMHVEGGIMFHP